MSNSQRAPHAVLDLNSRRHKALKIERLLGLGARNQPIKMLEIGTGSGGIAHYFARHASLDCEVYAVDVRDQRLQKEGFHYQTVLGTQLPFSNVSFDVVLTNHVIEHVGDHSAQMEHLSEIHRVLKTSGIGYLAVPNRWMLVEPHFKLAFLSWWPESLRTGYLRLMRKGLHYDCRPLERKQLESMLGDAGFEYTNLCIPALHETLEIERPDEVVTRFLGRVPALVWRLTASIFPTLIYRLAKGPSDTSNSLT